MKIIGLTGNIGSGKSSVARMFRELGAEIIDADQIARDVVKHGTPALEELIYAFGEQILNQDRSLNRQAVGDIVFNDKEKRETLNSIIHPRIYEEINKRLRELEAKNTDVAIIEAALIVEKKGLINLIDKLVVVSVDKAVQTERLMKRDGLSPEDISARINSQMENEEKIKHADYVIDNNQDLALTERQVAEIWEKLTGSGKNNG